MVDDNPTNRLILEEVLAHWGARTVAVDSGPGGTEEGLKEAARHGEPFAVVLLDQRMPGMDGLALAERVHGDPRIANTKMLMLTSDGGAEDASRCRALGISACLTKPVRQSELLNALMDLLRVCDGPGEDRRRTALIDRTVAPRPEPNGRRLRVLLAEDHPINQMVAARLLETLGHEVTVVGDGKAAVETLEGGTFDLVLMDVQMPEMDGFEAVAAIRAREAHSGGHVPVIALTAHAMKGDRERCLANGFDGYLAKPVQEAELRAAIGLATSEHAGGPEPEDTAPSAPPVFITGLIARCGHDEGFARELAESFLEAAPPSFAALTEAQAAGDDRPGSPTRRMDFEGASSLDDRAPTTWRGGLPASGKKQACRDDRDAVRTVSSRSSTRPRPLRGPPRIVQRSPSMKVLIAEDNAPSALFLRRTLEGLGHEVTVALDGAQAWEAIQRAHVPLLISDWVMPTMDGLELCRRIRGRVGCDYTYIILLSFREHRREEHAL